MALKPLFLIQIEPKLMPGYHLLIDKIHSIDLESDWQKMTDTGILKLPRKCVIKGQFGDSGYSGTGVTDLITTGSRIVVRLGYMANNIPVPEWFATEFIGYVAASPQPFAPVEIQLEDEMYQLKRTPVLSKTLAAPSKGIKVKDILNYLLPNPTFEIECADRTLKLKNTHYIIKKGSVASALKDMEGTCGIKSFFRLVPDPSNKYGARQVLVVGAPYTSTDLTALNPADDIKYEYRKNTISNNLKFRGKDDINLKVHVKVKMNGKGSTDLDFEVGDIGDPNATVIQKIYNNMSFKDASAFAQAEYDKSKVDRFEGDIASFGFPHVRHGRIVQYTDWRFGDKSNASRYFVDAVKVSSGVNGYRRTVHLGWLAGQVSPTNPRLI